MICRTKRVSQRREFTWRGAGRLWPGVAALIVMNEDDRSKQREVLTSAVKKALLSAAKEALGPLRQLRVEINQKTGAIHAFAKLVVAENVSDKRKEISLPDARQIKQQVEIGEELEVDVTPVGFGRVAARFAKQALMDQLRRAEGGL